MNRSSQLFIRSSHNNFTDISGREGHLKAAVATIGPISVAMDSAHESFHLYGGGIYYNKHCNFKPDDLDHAIIAVGYGTENNTDYWLLKNSWAIAV